MKKYFKKAGTILLLAGIISVQCNCSKKSTSNSGGSGGGGTTPPTPDNSDVAFWVTKADQSILLQKQTSLLALSSGSGTPATITLDSTQIFQTVDGFGYTLTGGSATLINA